MAKADVHTLYKGSRWVDEVEGGQRASNSPDTKAAAQAKGRQMAQSRKVEHLIHKQDGAIGARNSHGNDPASRPG
jgi:hypothetical protein